MWCRKDLRLIRLPLFFLTISLLVGLSIVFIADAMLKAQRHQLALMISKKEKASQQLAGIALERQDTFAGLAQLESMDSQGIMDKFDRIEVADNFEKTMSPLSNAGLSRYRISSRLDIRNSETTKLKNFSLSKYTLEFSAKPKHEEIFLQILERLQENTRGLVNLEQCHLSLAETTYPNLQSTYSLASGIDTRCTLVWYQFNRLGNEKDKKSSAIKPETALTNQSTVNLKKWAKEGQS